MNAENFHEYLKNPSLLYQANYQELKSLVVQYPYSSNLRLLLLLKSLIDNHKDFDRNLVLASMYGIDRAKLFEQVSRYEQTTAATENVVMNEEYLELKDLSVIEDLPETTDAGLQKPLEHALDIEEMFIPEEPAPHKADLGDLEDEADFLEDIPNVDLGLKRDAPEPPPLMSLEDLMADDFMEEEEENTEEEEGHEEEELEVAEDEDAFFGNDEVDEELKDEIDQIVEEAVQNAKEKLIEKGAFLRTIDDAAALAGIVGQFNSQKEQPVQNEEITAAESPVEEAAENSSEATEADAGLAEATEMDAELPAEATPPSDEAPEEEEPLSPIPTTKFSSWLQQLQPPQVSHEPPIIVNQDQAEKADEEEEEEEERTVVDEAKELAARSVVENLDIATETLAAVLESQGHYQKAIAMYERLMLKYPEKSTFFAAKIEELKSK
ncbi:MAG: hypothetical protein Kow0027_17860 [Saprospiraceae bacterium]